MLSNRIVPAVLALLVIGPAGGWADSTELYQQCKDFAADFKVNPDGTLSEGCGGFLEPPCQEGLVTPLGIHLVNCARNSETKSTEDCRAELEALGKRCAQVSKTPGYKAYFTFTQKEVEKCVAFREKSGTTDYLHPISGCQRSWGCVHLPEPSEDWLRDCEKRAGRVVCKDLLWDKAAAPCRRVFESEAYQDYQQKLAAKRAEQTNKLTSEFSEAFQRQDVHVRNQDINAWEQELKTGEGVWLALKKHDQKTAYTLSKWHEKEYGKTIEEVLKEKRVELVRWRKGVDQTILRNLVPRLDQALKESMQACAAKDWKTCEKRAKAGLDHINFLARLLPEKFEEAEKVAVQRTGMPSKMRLRLLRELSRIEGTGTFWVNTMRQRVKLKFADSKQVGTWKFPIKDSGGSLQVGQLVAASWKMADGTKRWYLAEISQISGEEVSVEYVDGDTGVRPTGEIRRLVASSSVGKGQSVHAARSNGARLHPGIVMNTGRHAAIVRWDDGTTPSSVLSGLMFR
jgi:hypothetical protein